MVRHLKILPTTPTSLRNRLDVVDLPRTRIAAPQLIPADPAQTALRLVQPPKPPAVILLLLQPPPRSLVRPILPPPLLPRAFLAVHRVRGQLHNVLTAHLAIVRLPRTRTPPNQTPLAVPRPHRATRHRTPALPTYTTRQLRRQRRSTPPLFARPPTGQLPLVGTFRTVHRTPHTITHRPPTVRTHPLRPTCRPPHLPTRPLRCPPLRPAPLPPPLRRPTTSRPTVHGIRPLGFKQPPAERTLPRHG